MKQTTQPNINPRESAIESHNQPGQSQQGQGETTTVANDGPNKGWSFKTIRNGNIVKQGHGYKTKEEAVAASQKPGNPTR